MSTSEERAGALLSIDLDAIAANWRICLSQLQRGTRAAAVVKADAYGLGAARVAPVLAAVGCSRFVVATLDEAISLRSVVPHADIIILGGAFPGTEEDFRANRLWPVLNCLEQVKAWKAFGKKLNQPQPAVLHVDTGMERLGLSHIQAEKFAAETSWQTDLDLRLIMSHLACADDPAHPLNAEQRDRFSRRPPFIPRSRRQSSGFFGNLFGGLTGNTIGSAQALRCMALILCQKQKIPCPPVVRLDAKIIQVRDVDAGHSVGYGATYRCSKNSQLAIAAAGYADGLFRTLGNRGCGYVGDVPSAFGRPCIHGFGNFRHLFCARCPARPEYRADWSSP